MGSPNKTLSLHNRITLASSLLIILIGFLSLLGWFTGSPLLNAFHPSYIPMAPNTALLFLTIGLALFVRTRSWHLKRTVVSTGGLFVAVVAVVRLLEYLAGLGTNIDSFFFSFPSEILGLAPTGRMAFFTAMTFSFAGASLLLLTLRTDNGDAFALAFGTLVLSSGLIFTLGYLYGAPLLYGTANIPMALNTALSFFILGTGLVSHSAMGRAVQRMEADELKSRLSAIVNSSNDAIFSKTLAGIVTSWNDGAERLYGYSAEEMIGNNISILLPPNHENEILDILNRIRRGETLSHYETKRMRKDGTVIDVSLTISPIVDNSGAVIGASAIAHDITEQKKSERRLKNLALEVTDLYDNAPCGYHSLDVEGRFVRINQTELDWFGYEKNELLGKRFVDLITEESKQVFAQNFPEFKKRGWVHDLEFDIIRKDGSLLPVLLNASIVYDSSGNFVMSRSTIIDNTERKLAEIALREKTIQLETANKELEAFSYSVSHDLRAPLRAIDGFSKILIEDYGKKLEPEMIRLLTIIKSNTERMGQLIDDLLSFSRISRKGLEKREIQMTELARSTFYEVVPRNNKLTLQLRELLPAYGDPALLKQVFHNLLSNAVKFTQKHPSPTIEIGNSLDGEATVYYVKDNGVGFDMKYYNKLFGVFQRLHSDDEFPGTGVGLAIVHRVISRHGGRVWATSEINHGTTFFFELPHAGRNTEGTQ